MTRYIVEWAIKVDHPELRGPTYPKVEAGKIIGEKREFQTSEAAVRFFDGLMAGEDDFASEYVSAAQVTTDGIPYRWVRRRTERTRPGRRSDDVGQFPHATLRAALERDEAHETPRQRSYKALLAEAKDSAPGSRNESATVYREALGDANIRLHAARDAGEEWARREWIACAAEAGWNVEQQQAQREGIGPSIESGILGTRAPTIAGPRASRVLSADNIPTEPDDEATRYRTVWDGITRDIFAGEGTWIPMDDANRALWRHKTIRESGGRTPTAIGFILDRSGGWKSSAPDYVRGKTVKGAGATAAEALRDHARKMRAALGLPEVERTFQPTTRQELTAVWTVGGKRARVSSVEDAQAKWEDFRSESGEGVSEIGNGVTVENASGQVVARISYNGRITEAGLPHNSPTIPARTFIAAKIRELTREGMPRKQAIAVAFEEARKVGYRSVPESPKRKRR